MQWIYWIIAVLLASAAALWVYRTDKKRAVPYPWITSLLRGLVVFFTLLLILVPSLHITQNTEEKPVVVLLQDNSRSIAIALGKDSAAFRANTNALLKKLSYKYKVVTWGFGRAVQMDTIFDYKQPATDISAALDRVQEYYGTQNLGAVILASDGRFNQGSNPMFSQSGLSGTLYTVALGDSTQQKDLRIAQAYANKTVSLNSTFELRADVVSRLCNGYSNAVSLSEAGKMLGSSPVAIKSDRYDCSVSFTIKAEESGLHHYILTIPPAEGEANTTNNRRDIFVEVVSEKKNILIVSASPHPDVYAIKDALSGLETYKVTVSSIDNFPSSLAGYDVIILHGLPSPKNNISAQLIAAKKPIWFILSAQSGVSAMNGLQEMTHTSFTSVPAHDMQAVYNTAFNTFTLPQQIQSVTDKMPPLTVAGNIYAATGANSFFTQKGQDNPLWLLQNGNVPIAILGGEGIWRWRLYEYKNFNSHAVIDECIRQTVAFLSANSHEKPFGVSMPKYIWSDQEPVALRAYLHNANNEQINTPEVHLTITDSAHRKHEFSFERSGNDYSLNIGIWAGGNYTYTAHTTYSDKEYSASGSFAIASIPLELMEQGADYALLYGLAKKYNGSFVTAPAIGSIYDSITRNDRIKPVIRTNTDTVPFVDRKWYFFLILLLAIGEWLLRKYWLAQ